MQRRNKGGNEPEKLKEGAGERWIWIGGPRIEGRTRCARTFLRHFRSGPVLEGGRLGVPAVPDFYLPGLGSIANRRTACRLMASLQH